MVDLIKETSRDSNETFMVMLKEMQTLNIIATLKEEDIVIRGILRGRGISSILEDLQKKYPEEKITRRDVEEFILLYKDIIFSQKTDIEKGYTRRLLKSKEGLTNQMADLASKATQMIDRYDEQGDNTNAVGALRAAADIFMKFAKVEGLVKDSPEINVNMQMDKIVTEVTTSDSEFKKSILKIINTPEEKEVVDAEFEVKENK